MSELRAILRMGHLDRSGWPRPFLMVRPRHNDAPKLLPVPWVNGSQVVEYPDTVAGKMLGKTHGFGAFNIERMERGVDYRLCAVCGYHVRPLEGEFEPPGYMNVMPAGGAVNGPLVFMRFTAEGSLHDQFGKYALTDGPGCCVRCAVLAAKFCPHINALPESEHVAYAYYGAARGVLAVPQHKSMHMVKEPFEKVTRAQLRELLKDWTPGLVGAPLS